MHVVIYQELADFMQKKNIYVNKLASIILLVPFSETAKFDLSDLFKLLSIQ